MKIGETVHKRREIDLKGLRFFISNCNGVIGQSFINELRNDHIEDDPQNINLFIGKIIITPN